MKIYRVERFHKPSQTWEGVFTRGFSIDDRGKALERFLEPVFGPDHTWTRKELTTLSYGLPERLWGWLVAPCCEGQYWFTPKGFRRFNKAIDLYGKELTPLYFLTHIDLFEGQEPVEYRIISKEVKLSRIKDQIAYKDSNQLCFKI